jgi:hypothetical protein
MDKKKMIISSYFSARFSGFLPGFLPRRFLVAVCSRSAGSGRRLGTLVFRDVREAITPSSHMMEWRLLVKNYMVKYSRKEQYSGTARQIGFALVTLDHSPGR